jgi:hypothetical protein
LGFRYGLGIKMAENRKEYLNRFKRLRLNRVLKVAGKPLIFDEDQMLQAIFDRKVPTCCQHCIIKVFKKMKAGQHPRDKDAYLSAFNICAWVFKTYGYMYKTKGSMKLTGKGQKNNRRHQRERDAGVKRGKYEQLTNKLWRASLQRIRDDRRNSRISRQKTRSRDTQ